MDDDQYMTMITGEHQESGMPWVAMPVTEAMQTHFGRVVSAWSLVETATNMLISAMLASKPLKEPKWKYISFPDKVTLFRDLTEECFFNENDIKIFLLDAIAEAEAASELRNSIVHGEIHVKAEIAADGLALVTARFKLIRKNAIVTTKMMLTEIEDFSFHLQYVAGMLTRFDLIKVDALLSAEDRSKLQDFLRIYYPTHPSLVILTPRAAS